MSATVAAEQRFMAHHPCPVCGGHTRLPSGQGVRCYGFLSSDGRYAHCTRPEYAGLLEPELGGDTYAHRLDGPCRCGETHRDVMAPPRIVPARSSPITAEDPPAPPHIWRDFRQFGAVRAYDYRDEQGTLLFQAWRIPKDGGGKTFKQARPVAGGWALGIAGVRRVLYRLPELLDTDPAVPVLLCEGEKDADRLASLGFVATTAPMGAGKWLPEYSESLRGRHVVALLDNDDEGEKHGRVVADALPGIAASLSLLRLPDLSEKGDVSDWLDAGNDPRTLASLIANAPRVTPRPAITIASAPAMPADPAWPVLDDAALHGLAGEIVRAIDPHTEGDPVAILLTTLVEFGSAVGRAPHCMVGATRHGVNEFVVLVGRTSRARKGTAGDEARRLVMDADPGWGTRVVGGLSSGEGLIHAVRDATSKRTKEGEPVLDDPGVEDKRLCVIESEFASVLKVGRRDGNTVTEILRCAWDGNDLRTLTRNSPLVATRPHISLIGHITEDELRRTLDDTSQTNGYFNRFAVACVRRSKLLPHGGSLDDATVTALARRVAWALDAARRRGLVVRDAEANAIWERVYPELTAERPGMFGAITARAEAHVLRLSLLYALLDGAAAIGRPHLEAALALWEYCEDSARYLFGDATGNPVADRVLTAVRRAPGGVDQSALVNLFGRNLPAAKLAAALEELQAKGLIVGRSEETGGRPKTRWEAAA